MLAQSPILVLTMAGIFDASSEKNYFDYMNVGLLTGFLFQSNIFV